MKVSSFLNLIDRLETPLAAVTLVCLLNKGHQCLSRYFLFHCRLLVVFMVKYSSNYYSLLSRLSYFLLPRIFSRCKTFCLDKGLIGIFQKACFITIDNKYEEASHLTFVTWFDIILSFWFKYLLYYFYFNTKKIKLEYIT